MNNILKDMISNETININQKGKIVYLDILDIIPNENNMFRISDIELLSENIKDEGLLQPLVVYKENNKNVLHTGHRRLEALKQLINKGYEYSFFGKNITGSVPVIYIDNSEKDDIENLVSMIRSNSYRQLGNGEKNKLIDVTERYVTYLESIGKKPKGRRREIISEITGININYVREYLLSKNKETEEYKTKIKNKKENIEDNKIHKIIKSIEKINKELSVINIEEIDMDDYKKLKETIDELKLNHFKEEKI